MEKQAKQHQNWWQQIKIHPVRTVLIALLAVVIVLIILLGYIFNWDWTGLGPYIGPPHSKDSDFQRGKTLWDWLNLLGVLAIPVVVGIGAAWYTAQQGKVRDKEHIDNQREAALQAYIDKMSELMLHEGLLGPHPKEEIREIARIRTLTVLAHLDSKRKGSVLAFLNDSKLINRRKRIIALNKANLSGAYLSEAFLSGTSLREVDLSGAYLGRARLGYIQFNRLKLEVLGPKDDEDIEEADLSYANLSNSNLSGADLKGVILLKANLTKADLSEADLKGVTGTTIEELEKQAKSLKGATMPDGSIHP